MNSDEIWLLQLWSGTFAAAGSGAVAVLVLYFSNRHQSRLAELARRQAAYMAEEQLEAQATALRRQIDEQRAGLDLQLAEQASEAARSRQIAAIAELVAVADALLHGLPHNGRSEIHEAFLGMRSAQVKLQMSGPDASEIATVLKYWPHYLAGLAYQYLTAKDGSREELRDVVDLVNDFVSALGNMLPEWTDASPARRSLILDVLGERSKKSESQSAASKASAAPS